MKNITFTNVALVVLAGLTTMALIQVGKANKKVDAQAKDIADLQADNSAKKKVIDALGSAIGKAAVISVAGK